MMRYLSYSILLSILAFPVWADEIKPLNRVNMELKAEQWVATKTALVTIGINAALADKAFEKMHAEILTKLKQLSSQAEWHIISFNRSTDRAGLEQLQAQAVARLFDTDIANLRNQVKNISKPGETYSVDDIQYTPSDQELRDAKTALRENIYQQINAEIARLNKEFPAQKYFLNEANFNTSPPIPGIVSFAKTANAVASNGTPAVSDKLQMSANVILASVPPRD